ncbi:MAG TPA: redoxin domain-containing protein [Terriglobia bacterium]|nr:redoxin domain-containing protein [Terriglobia bacterium]
MADRAAFSERRNGQHAPSPGKTRKRARTLLMSAACVAVLCLVASPAAFSASPEVGDILRKVGSVYGHLQDYHIVAVRENVFLQPRVGFSRRSVITLDAAGPGRVRMTLAGDGPNVLVVSDGKTTWHYAPGKNEYTKREAPALLAEPGMQGPVANRTDLLGQMQDLLVGRFVKLWQFEKDATFRGEATVEFQGRETPCYQIVFHINGLTDRLWIDQSAFLVLQEKSVQALASTGSRSLVDDNIRVTEIGIHTAHLPGLFTFDPPSGARRVAALNLPGVWEGFMGYPAGDFTLQDVAGKQVSLSDFRGKTVLLSFWATWCLPCKAELPTLQKIYEQRKDVAVLAVDDESKATVRSFLKDKHYDFTALMDQKRTLFKKFGVRFIPTVFVINGEGVIVREMVGWEGPQKLLAALQAAESGRAAAADAAGDLRDKQH